MFNFENQKISNNFQFDKLSYILSVRTIQTDLNIKNNFENKKIE